MPPDLKNRFQFFTKAENIPTYISQITSNVRVKMKKYIEELCKEVLEC
jgi:hypothetical protein